MLLVNLKRYKSAQMNTNLHKFVFVLFVFLLASCTNPSRQQGSIHGIMGQREETVYVCTGPMSQCYHATRYCKGLERCSKSVEAVSVAEAVQAGRRPCKWCH